MTSIFERRAGVNSLIRRTICMTMSYYHTLFTRSAQPFESYQLGAHTSNTNHKAYLRAGRRDLCALLYQKNPTLLELFVVPQHINYHMRAAALTASPLTTRLPDRCPSDNDLMRG